MKIKLKNAISKIESISRRERKSTRESHEAGKIEDQIVEPRSALDTIKMNPAGDRIEPVPAHGKGKREKEALRCNRRELSEIAPSTSSGRSDRGSSSLPESLCTGSKRIARSRTARPCR